MKIVPIQVSIINPNSDTEPLNGEKVLKHLERCGRTCYRSEGKISAQSAPNFVKNLIARGHESVLEHYAVTADIVCDRATSHQIVRHRLASYSQESQRYVCYLKEEFGSEVNFIKPPNIIPGTKAYDIWAKACADSEAAYFELLAEGVRAEDARDVLNNACKTELKMTANLREWRHFFKTRCDRAAAPRTRLMACMALKKFSSCIPVVFDDILAIDNIAEFMYREAL